MTTNLSAELGRASETVAGFPLERHVPFGSITSFTVSGLQAIQATRGPAGPRSKAAWQIEIEKWVKAGWRFNLDLALTTAAAQADLDYGEWGHLWDSWQSEDRPFNLRKGETLVFVGKNMGKLEPQDRAVLPRSLGALEALAHLETAILLRLIRQELVERKMTVAEAEDLVERHNPCYKRKTGVFKAGRILTAIQKGAALLEKEGEVEVLETAETLFRMLADQMRAKAGKLRKLEEQNHGPNDLEQSQHKQTQERLNNHANQD